MKQWNAMRHSPSSSRPMVTWSGIASGHDGMNTGVLEKKVDGIFRRPKCEITNAFHLGQGH